MGTFGTNPGARARCRAELLADPSRSDAEIAVAASAGISTATDVRRQLRRKDRPPPPESARPAKVPEMPKRPDFSRAACTRHAQPDLWTSKDPAERTAAVYVCTTACQVLAQCQTWALALPVSTDLGAVLGGLTGHQRLRIRAEERKAKAAAAARLASARAAAAARSASAKAQTHCAHGHPLSGPNVRIVQRAGGPRRVCLTCKRIGRRKSYRAQRQAA